MANVKVSELPAASAASTSQEFEVNDSGTSKKVTGGQIKSFVKDGLVLSDITNVTASVAELNTLDGITSTAAELNILDGANVTTAASLLANPKNYLDPENRIINGAFDFWQRGTSFTGQQYTADRWFVSTVGGTVTTSRQAFIAGNVYAQNNPTHYLRQTVSGQSGTNYAYVNHRIEGVRSYAGQTITVLGWARRFSGSGNMRVGAIQVFGTGGSPSSAAGIAEQTVTLTGTFEPFAIVLAVPSIAGKTLGSNNNDYLEILFALSNGNGIGIQTIGVDLWGIHIKLGTHTTDAVSLYKQPERGPELLRCYQYFELGTGGIEVDHLLWRMGITVPYKFSKRSTPSVSINNQNLGAKNIDVSSGIVEFVNADSCHFECSKSSNFGTGSRARWIFGFSVDAEL